MTDIEEMGVIDATKMAGAIRFTFADGVTRCVYATDPMRYIWALVKTHGAIKGGEHFNPFVTREQPQHAAEGGE